MSRFRFTKRRGIAIAAIVGVAVALGVIPVLTNRAEKFSVAAEKYGEYAHNYDDTESEQIRWSTCYGQRWDAYTETVSNDLHAHGKDTTYCKAKASYYRQLSQNYQRAARYPWLPVAPDPP